MIETYSWIGVLPVVSYLGRLLYPELSFFNQQQLGGWNSADHSQDENYIEIAQGNDYGGPLEVQERRLQ